MGDGEQYQSRIEAIKTVLRNEILSKFAAGELRDLVDLLQSGTSQTSQTSTPTPVLPQSNQSNGICKHRQTFVGQNCIDCGAAYSVPLIRRFEKDHHWTEVRDTQPVTWRSNYGPTNWVHHFMTFQEFCNEGLSRGWKEVSMSGFDGNDIQCCDPTGLTIYMDGRKHNVSCPRLLRTESKPGCDHTFQSYTGIRETFEFCTKCDEKKAL